VDSATVDSVIESWRDCAVVFLYEQSRDVLTHYYDTAIHEFEPAAASQLGIEIDILRAVLLL
jgi:hypothetical protein